MCTVTIVTYLVAGERRVRLACNRDERRSRPPARTPQRRRYGEREAVLPIDPLSQGTWIAANDAGLALTILNQSPSPPFPDHEPRRSRGIIIPALLHCEALDEAIRRAADLPAEDFAPFRLVLVTGDEFAAVRADGERTRLEERSPLRAPVFFTSSALGNHIVLEPRRRVFDGYFEATHNLRRQQDAFHRHSWPDRTHLSVCMSRADARTVSYTAVEIGSDAVAMTYWPAPPDQPAEPVSLVLGLRQRVPA